MIAGRSIDIVISAHDMATSILNRVETSLSTFGAKVRTAASSLFSVQRIALAAAAAVASLAYGLVRAVQAANEAGAAEAKLNATLRSTAGVAGMSKEALMELADEMQRTTTMEGDAVVVAESLMLTFTRVNKDVFPSAIKLAADLSVGLGQDLQSSVLQVGKALQDPVAGITALSRAGVQLSDTQKRQIKDFMAVNDIASAQKIIMGELTTQFGGQAEAAAATFGGRLIQLKNVFGDLEEEIGFVITRNIVAIGAVDMLKDAFARMGQWVKDNRVWLMELTKSGIVTFVKGVGMAIEALRFFHNGWLGLELIGNITSLVFADSLRVIFEGLRLVLGPLDLIFDGLVKLGTISANPFDKGREAIGRFQVATRESGAAMITEIEQVNTWYDSASSSVRSYAQALREMKVTQAEALSSAASPVGGGDSGAPKGDGVQPSPDAAQDKELLAMQKRIDLSIRKNQIENEHLLEEEARLERRIAMMGVELTNQQAADELSAYSTQARSNIVASAYKAMEDQMLSLVETGHFSVAEFGKVVAQQVKMELVGLAARATIWAIYETAMGIANLAYGNVASASLHFASAVKFGAVAVGALATAATVHSVVGGSASRPAPGTAGGEPLRTRETAPLPSSSSSASSQKQTQSITVIINNPLSDQNWERIAQDNIIPAINAAGERNVKISLNAVEAN